MGQKVNPIGLRLGINRTWDSRWFAGKNEYGKLLHEDIAIRAALMKTLKQAAVSKIIIERWPELATALRRAGIESLYSHQLRAWETAPRSDLIVTSGTASGKSLAFNLPVLDGIARDSKRRALYL